MYEGASILRAFLSASSLTIANSADEVCAPLHFDDDTVTLFANGAVAECVFGFLAPAAPNGNSRKMANICTYIRRSATDETFFSQSTNRFFRNSFCQWFVCCSAPVDEGRSGRFVKAVFIYCSGIT